jgi:FlaA1/EpsC-like NDP-sugar epimerase
MNEATDTLSMKDGFLEFQGKTVVVTGGVKGIGASIVEQFASNDISRRRNEFTEIVIYIPILIVERVIFRCQKLHL